MARTIEPERNRASALDPEAERLRQEWTRASARLFAAYTERLHGKATHQELAEALAHARTARAAWSRVSGSPVDLREMEGRHVLDVVRIRIEGGARFLRGPLEAHRRTLLETAASRAANLPDGDARRLAVVAWPAGRDLHGAVYFNQRTRPERTPVDLDPERMRAGLKRSLGDEIRRLAPSLDPTAQARAHELGRVDARFPEPVPARDRAAAGPETTREPALQQSDRIVVTLERERVGDAMLAANSSRTDQAEVLDRLQPRERDWSQERVFAVRVRVPTGAEQLDALSLNADERAQIIHRAVDRAYPFLQQEGLRDSFLYRAQGRALDVQGIVPEKLGWTPQQTSLAAVPAAIHHGLPPRARPGWTDQDGARSPANAPRLHPERVGSSSGAPSAAPSGTRPRASRKGLGSGCFQQALGSAPEAIPAAA